MDISTLNLPTPTLGGKQLWGDVFYRAGWRIQRQHLTGHFRLLDPCDLRRAWGSYRDCRRAFSGARIAAPERHLVLLLHGMWRSKDSLRPLTRALRAAGQQAAGINYPSTRATIAEHAAQVDRLLSSLDRRIEAVSFVTHSLGGLVVRQLLSQPDARWRSRLSIDRVLMLFPPNQGAAMADRWHRNPLFDLLLGPAGRQLTTWSARGLPPLRERFGVIAGDVGNGQCDGTVRIEETWLAGAEDWTVLPAGHTLGMRDPRVIGQALRYLRLGRFSEGSRSISWRPRAHTARRRPANHSVPA